MSDNADVCTIIINHWLKMQRDIFDEIRSNDDYSAKSVYMKLFFSINDALKVVVETSKGVKRIL